VEKDLLHRALGEPGPNVPDSRDLSQTHRVVADGIRLDESVPVINHDNVIIRKGIIFKSMEEMKLWLAEYTVFHHRPFIVTNSNENKCYSVSCRRGCSWTVRGRRTKDGTWRISSVVQSHTCVTAEDDRKHP